jgi:hypothetical protein
MANLEIQKQIELAPENKSRVIVKETAQFISIVVDMIPPGKIGWFWAVTNIKTLMEIIRLLIDLINRIKTIINE